jgi:hypothetical protein
MSAKPSTGKSPAVLSSAPFDLVNHDAAGRARQSRAGSAAGASPHASGATQAAWRAEWQVVGGGCGKAGQRNKADQRSKAEWHSNAGRQRTLQGTALSPRHSRLCLGRRRRRRDKSLQPRAHQECRSTSSLLRPQANGQRGARLDIVDVAAWMRGWQHTCARLTTNFMTLAQAWTAQHIAASPNGACRPRGDCRMVTRPQSHFIYKWDAMRTSFTIVPPLSQHLAHLR